MSEKIIAEGKTTTEAIENGLKQLKVSKDMVEIKVLDSEDKRSFFSILAPRVVKVEMTLKDNVQKDSKPEKVEKEEKKQKEFKVSKEDIEIARKNIEEFFEKFIPQMPENTKFEIYEKNENLYVNLNNEKLGFLIGYRGETLYAFQNILSAIANKNSQNRVRVILDIEGYKEKREKTLEDLAEKISKTVVKTGKSVTLEPMKPYERKIIHSKLQTNNKVTTKSIGEEPHRRVVISLK